jgi:hypothetical protein
MCRNLFAAELVVRPPPFGSERHQLVAGEAVVHRRLPPVSRIRAVEKGNARSNAEPQNTRSCAEWNQMKHTNSER